VNSARLAALEQRLNALGQKPAQLSMTQYQKRNKDVYFILV